jgi:predicted ATPase
VHLNRREPERALEHAKRALVLSEKHALAMQCAAAKGLCGAALIDLGEARQGVVLIAESLHDGEQLGLRIGRASKLRRLAAGAMAMTQWELATKHFNEAFEEVEISGERWYEAELHRCKGEFFLSRGGGAATASAEVCFLESLDIARSQGAKSWELRTSTSLARMWQRQGRIDHARNLPCPIYGSFTEGFDTKDLQEAKIILSKLA